MSAKTVDPIMPKLIPHEVERALAIVLGYRNRPEPVEVYDAIREALEARAVRGATPYSQF